MNTELTKIPKPIVLIILDGFGVTPETRGNAIHAAKKPNLDSIEQRFPCIALQASGIAVGLPWGEAGNSEVGHLTLGAGRVIYQHLTRIIVAIHDGSFYQNPAFGTVAETVKANQSALHLVGLVSSGSVHSYLDHLYALLEFAKQQQVPRVFLHAITDGRDAPRQEAGKMIRELQERLATHYPRVTIASLIGRFYAMDRDLQWDRIRQAYELLVRGRGQAFGDPLRYLAESYTRGASDEFLEPAYLARDGQPIGRIEAGDGLILFNFREDSMRELTEALAQEPFAGFPRGELPRLSIATMTEYEKNLAGVASAFPPLAITWPLARVLSEAGKAQLHIAESEKYAHITYFFNGGIEQPFPHEDRILVPSLSAPHAEEHPAMRAAEVTAGIIERLGQYDFILANFANADMVGHTGNFAAVVSAIEVLDREIGRLAEAVLAREGVLLLTGDHGSAEQKIHLLSGEPMAEHTTNPVPFYLIGKEYQREREPSASELRTAKKEVRGILTDIAPLILELMRLPQPPEMTGKSLLPLLTRD